MLQSALPWAGCTVTHFSQQNSMKKKRDLPKMQEYITWKEKKMKQCRF